MKFNNSKMSQEEREQRERFTTHDVILIFVPFFYILIARYLLLPNFANIWWYSWILFQIYAFIYAEVGLLNLLLRHERYSGFWIANVIFGILVATLVINGVVLGFGRLWVRNSIAWFSPLLILFVAVFFSRKYSVSAFKKLLRQFTFAGNIFFWLNVPLIVLEYLGVGGINSRFLALNSFQPDQTTGLIGYNGTGIMAVFWAFLIVSNALSMKRGHAKRAALHLVLLVFTMLFISIQMSEIKSFIPISASAIGMIFIANIRTSNSIRGAFKILVILASAILVFEVAYNRIQVFQQLIDKLLTLFGQIISLDSSDVSNERAYILSLLFTNYNAGHLGIGLNNLNLDLQTIHIHFALNDLNVLLGAGGVSLCVITILMIPVMFTLILKNGFSKQLGIFLSTLIFVLIVTLSSKPFTDQSIFYMIFLLFIPLKVAYSDPIRRITQENET